MLTNCPWRDVPDSKVHGDIMGPIWGPQDPGGPHVGPMNLAIWGGYDFKCVNFKHSLGVTILNIQTNITLGWMPVDLFDGQCIGSDDGLVPTGNKPLHEPILTQI